MTDRTARQRAAMIMRELPSTDAMVCWERDGLKEDATTGAQ